MGRTPLLLYLSLLAAAPCPAQPPASDRLAIERDTFRASWDLARSGQLVRLEARDHRGFFPLSVKGGCLGDLRISDGEREYAASRGRLLGTPKVYESDGITRIDVCIVPAATDGSPAPIELSQTFYCYDEGAVFCDFTLSFPQGAERVRVTSASLSASLASGA